MGASFVPLVFLRLRYRPSLIAGLMICWLHASCVIKCEASDHEQVAQSQGSKHPVTIADVIRMTHLASDTLAYFSPDGTKFVCVLRKGNLEENTNEYSILLWQANKVFSSPGPEIILTLSSSSNREAIKAVRWLNDNETLTFLGEGPGELQQLYTINIRTHALKKLTNHLTNIVSYSLAPTSDSVAYVAEEPAENLFDAKSHREGYAVSTEWLSDLVAYKKGGWVGENQLFFLSKIGHEDRRISVRGRINIWNGPHLSPDGKFIVISTQVRDIPESWKEYTNPELPPYTQRNLAPGQFSDLMKYELIDTTTGESRTLLNSPAGLYGSEVTWSPDGQSIVITNTYLPLDGTDPDERKIRLSSRFTVEVKIPSGETLEISKQDLKLLEWETLDNEIIFQVGRQSYRPESLPRVAYAKSGGRWGLVINPKSESTRPNLFLEEGMNTPPKLFVIEPTTHRKAVLLDLNPQFKDLEFAKVEEIKWKGSDGHEVKGGLYYPLNYVPGKKYPLVIQGHAWTSEKFWIDGPWPSAFAAQSLAGKGIIVLQADEDLVNDLDTPKEVNREVATFEGAIDYLDSTGLIDRDRVGLSGFSRTCLFVEYALTHSKYHFSAASITDGVDGGYFQYLAFSNAAPDWSGALEGMNGAAPFGEGLNKWMERSPGFNVDKVKVPVRLVALDPLSIFLEWEWFAALRRERKPVELILVEDGAHVLQRPLDRMVSQQGNVDWFAFWLKGEEEPDAAKAEQYARWREMRKIQEESQKTSSHVTSP